MDPWIVPDETQFGTDLGVIPDDDIAAIAAQLGRTLDANQGAFDISFFEGARGGETGAISAASDPAFTFDLAADPKEQPGVIVDANGRGDLVYTGVDPAEGPVTATVAGVSGATRCIVAETPGTTYPIVEKAITIAYAFCESAE